MSGEPCCLNCKYWQIDTQLFGPADGVICRAGYGHTAPYDCCDEFRREFDDYGCLDGGGYTGGDKFHKMSVYNRSRYADNHGY